MSLKHQKAGLNNAAEIIEFNAESRALNNAAEIIEFNAESRALLRKFQRMLQKLPRNSSIT